MSALIALLNEESRQDAWQTYMANIGRMIIGGMSGGKATYPWWGDIAGGKPKAERSGQEIFDEIIAHVRGKG